MASEHIDIEQMIMHIQYELSLEREASVLADSSYWNRKTHK